MTLEEGSYLHDILGGFVSSDDFIQSSVLKGSSPSRASGQSGSWDPGMCWGAQAGLGNHEAATPKPPTWPQTVTSFLLAVRKCWGR